MAAPSEDESIDEDALNVLLAEEVDLPTALAASRRGSVSDSSNSGCAGVVILTIAAHMTVAAMVL